MKAIFSSIIEITISINSNSLLSENTRNKSLQLADEHNKVMSYLEGLRLTGAKQYSFSFNPIIKLVEDLQSEILK